MNMNRIEKPSHQAEVATRSGKQEQQIHNRELILQHSRPESCIKNENTPNKCKRRNAIMKNTSITSPARSQLGQSAKVTNTMTRGLSRCALRCSSVFFHFLRESRFLCVRFCFFLLLVHYFLYVFESNSCVL